ncbi:hypothetical protein AMTR_s00122p00114480 [Amborella trichopoda]|uniref:NAB domain-containing protein n=1 Tax=Amborella trichopoda TaxID=13333 RepID=W1NME6_AMBTC|nr:hypothetical protein AMTR_s00122p00114480 [Amborella trichopoda]
MVMDELHRQSKWLDQNLRDMEVKVKSMLKLIEEDVDSLAKRAEMFYKERHERGVLHGSHSIG